MFKKTLIGSVVILLIFAALGYTLPAEYESKRTLEINAPIEVVFDFVNTTAKNEVWSPWIALDPGMKLSYNEIPSGVGARYEWESASTGKGTTLITSSDAPRSIEMDIDFGKDGVAKSFWIFEQSGDKVRATWGIRGSAGINPLARYFGLMMDRMIGVHFETGLSRLKKAAESV
jgi:hypothetical protein